MVLLAIVLIVTYLVFCKLSQPSQSVIKAPKGRFVVRAFKNGEMVHMRTYKDEYFVVRPGTEWDKVEITES